MPLVARRVFRLSFTTAITLAVAYALAIPFPFIAPIFAFILTSIPSFSLNLKKLLVLNILFALTLGIGLWVTPLIVYYPVSGIMIVGLGLYFSAYLTVNLGKGMVGSLIGLGFSIIPAAGAIDYMLATTVIKSLIVCMSLAVIVQWVVYPFFPEDEISLKQKTSPETPRQCNWIALRFTFIVLPPFILALINPSVFFKTIVKSTMLGKQGSEVEAKHAGRELLGSTLLGGFYAALFWGILIVKPDLWMFFLLTLIFSIYFAAKLYRVLPTRFSGPFWQDVSVTMLILLGLAISDSENGSNVYQAFFQRMSIFIGLAFYAWGAVYFLDALKNRKLKTTKNLISENS